MTSFYAHTKGTNQSEWEPLREHLQLVSERAERFARKFDAAAWGKTLGWWHDLGKYSAQFQNYLVKSANTDVHQSEIIGRIDHSTAGSIHAVRQFGPNKQLISHALAFCIAGHHAGLANAIADGPPRSLSERLTKQVSDFSGAPADILMSTNLTFGTALGQSFQELWMKVHCQSQFRISHFRRVDGRGLLDCWLVQSLRMVACFSM